MKVNGAPTSDITNLCMMVAEDISALQSVIVMTEEMLNQCETDVTNTLTRMIFSNGITILETFLSEAIISVVFSSDIALERLIAAPPLNERKLEYIEVFNNPNAVRDRVFKYLSESLYHKLNNVEKLYKVALGIEIFVDHKLKQDLEKAVAMRHGIVHRNGRNQGRCSLDDSRRLIVNIQSVVHRIYAEVTYGK